MSNRIIKESSCSSETLAKCSLGANLLFLRLTTKADDHGCFDARAKIIIGTVFPLWSDTITESNLDEWLQELVNVDCIRLWFHSNNVRYGIFPNFSDHQRIRSLHQRRTPEPPNDLTTNKPILADNCRQLSADVGLNPNPNPNPNPNLKKHIVRKKDLALNLERFEQIWKDYPSKKGKHKAWIKFRNQVITEKDLGDIQKALVNYIADVGRIRESTQPDLQYQNGSTWFHENWRDYVEMEKPLTWAEKADLKQKERIKRKEAGERKPDF